MLDRTGTAEFHSRIDSALSGDGGPITDARRVWRALGASGIVSDLYRGHTNRPDDHRLSTLLTALDERVPFEVVLSVCVQVATVIPLLRDSVTRPGIVSDVIDRLLEGRATVALGVTDHGISGSALLAMRTKVSLAADQLTVAGGKDWITNAVWCDYALVLCRFREARHMTSFCWVIVPAGSPGLVALPAGVQQFTSAGLGHLRFQEVQLDIDHLVERPGRALLGFARHVATERLAGALWARALCRRVLADTRAWLAQRQTLTGTLWDNAAVRERYARCVVEFSRIDALADTLARRYEAGGTNGVDMAVKASVGESVDQILGGCAALRGADSLRAGGEAWLRAAASVFAIGGGATGAMLAGVASHADVLLGTDAPDSGYSRGCRRDE